MRVLALLQHLLFAGGVCTALQPTKTLVRLVRRDDQPAVSTVGVPSNGHQPGDIIITVPENDNKVLDQIISQNICPDSKLHKRFVSECFLKNGEAMYGSMHTGGMPGLIAAARSGLELPIPPSELDGGTLAQFDQLGGDLPGLDQQAQDRLGRIIWWVQYPALISKIPAQNAVKVIPAVVASRTVPVAPATSSARCHYPDRIPYCANCGGLGGNLDRETCVGFGDLWKSCPCLKRTPFPPNKIPPTQEKLRPILEQMIDRANVTCLGNNATQDIGLWSKIAEKACENNDLTKFFLRENMSIADLTDTSKYSAYQRYKYTFRWDSQPNQYCSKSCKEMFSSFMKCGDESKSEMARTGASQVRCGTASYKIEDNPALRVACRQKALQAPRGDKEASGATSLDKAIGQFCTDNDSKGLKKGANIYQRYGITEYGVKDRSSFWLRGAITCGEEDHMKRGDCVDALNEGMGQCDAGSGFSHGLAASFGCVDYSIDLSGVTRDESPPWDQKVQFPPPEDAERPDGAQHEVICTQRAFKVRENALPAEELNEAIDKFCQNGADIRGLGTKAPWLDKMFSWPSGKDPKFLMGAILNSDSAAVVNDKKNWKPYKDMRWCDNYDWKMGKDDCTYALRKMHQMCTHDKVLAQGDFTYRCVRYTYAYPGTAPGKNRH